MKAGKSGGRNRKFDNVVSLPGAVDVAVDPPRDLTGDALERWNYLAPELIASGHLTTRTRGPFAEYCRCLSELAELRKLVSDEGAELEGRRDGIVKNPNLSTIKVLRDHCIKYETLFGLTPLALASMPKMEPPRANVWDRPKKPA